MKNHALLLSVEELEELDTPRFEKLKPHKPSNRDIEQAFQNRKGSKHNRADRRSQKRNYDE